MKTVQGVLHCVLLAAVTALVGYIILLVRTATTVAAAIPGQIESTRIELTGQVDAVRRDLDRQINATRRELLDRTERQVTAIRTDVLAEADEIRETADRRLGESLTKVDRALETVDALRGDLKPALDHVGAISAQVNDALPMFLDCDDNPDCVFNRYVGASRGLERAADNFGMASTDVRKALPAAITTWQSIGSNANGIAANVNQLTKPKWYDRLIGYGLNGVVIYRNLNPASLTVRSAQLLSSRP
ncbi:MAG TPA: hypothetical protein VML19_22490 [Verrucomicrobiae bacterium]|nr:hypothetical protein [Verrucomicrobiae bacterium]